MLLLDRELGPQRLKPALWRTRVARLKPCKTYVRTQSLSGPRNSLPIPQLSVNPYRSP